MKKAKGKVGSSAKGDLDGRDHDAIVIAKSHGLYILIETDRKMGSKKRWVVYRIDTGRTVATIYPGSGVFFLHAGENQDQQRADWRIALNAAAKLSSTT